MEPVKLTVIGCSPAWPNPGGAQSGYLVETEGSLLLDCGPGVLARLRLDGGWPEPDAIALTHFHLDHCGDLIPWVWGSFYERDATDRRLRPELWVPPGGRRRLAGIGSEFGFANMFEQVFSIAEYEPGKPFVAGGQTVTAVRMLHYRIDAYGFRVSNDGTTLAYSGDSGPGGQLAELARDADLFVCEATLAAGADEGETRGHLTLEEAEAAFAAAGARRLLVTHRPVELETPSRLELAADGLVLEL
jgi:ribonuclease BN (tRNA processing enzyme)